jgi:glutamine amidotransferase
MCRLFGLRANKAVDVEFSLLTGATTMRQLGKKHAGGWGVGWYEGATAAVKKEPISAATSEQFPQIVKQVKSPTVITHVRWPTQGDPTVANTHPFQYQNWLFAHNGGLKHEPLLTKLDATHRSAVQGETDSEVFFHWILQNMERTKSVPDGLRIAVKEASGFTGLNFVLTDGANLYAYRNAATRTGYYSLYYLRRDPKPGGMDEFQSAEVKALLRSKDLRGEKAVLVCSEKLTSEAWQEIPLGSLLVVSQSLSTDLVEVK